MNRNLEMHLTKEEIKDFVLEELSEGAARAVESHLEICVECAQLIEDYYAAQEEFPEAQWAAQRKSFVASLREQIFGDPLKWLRNFLDSFRHSLLDYLVLIPQPEPKPSFYTKREPVDLESDNGAFGLFMIEEDDGSVTLRFDTSELELEGVTIRFRKGKWQHDATLSKVHGNRLGAEVVVRRDEREMLAGEGELLAEPVGKGR